MCQVQLRIPSVDKRATTEVDTQTGGDFAPEFNFLVDGGLEGMEIEYRNDVHEEW